MIKGARTASLILATLSVAAGLAVGGDKAPGAGSTEGRTRVVRTWSEPMVIQGQSVMGRISYIFNYDTGTFRRVTQDHRGRTLESKEFAPGEAGVTPSKEEIDEAFEMVRSDAEFSRILDQTGGQVVGGFGLSEGPGMPCGPGSRCLHVQINTADGWGIVRWAVVDLSKRGFAYRAYRPEMSQGGAR
jgi:hypothetical protein